MLFAPQLFPIFTCILSKKSPLRLNRGDKNGKRLQKNYCSLQEVYEIRDADWQLILDLKIKKLPVKISEILTALGIEVHTYKDNYKMLIEFGLKEQMKTCDAFTLFLNGKYMIFYDETKSAKRIRFTLAHELGHIILGSGFTKMSSGLLVSTRNSEPTENDAPEETEANMFAARLLAPSCVLHELKLFTVEEIMQFCSITKTSATFRLKRLMLLEERNERFLRERGHGCYYISPLEQEVRQQFDDYINTVRKYRA